MSGNNQYAILYVDDETIALKYFEKGFASEFKVMTAASAEEGWKLIQARYNEIGVLMTDQRMPGQTGVELLEKVRQSYPNIIRILVTAYSDIGSAIAAVNTGAIYKYISKPWVVDDLRITLLRAMDYFVVLNERDQLLGEKLSVLQQIILSDRAKNLGVLAAGFSSCYRNSLQAAARLIDSAPIDDGRLVLRDQDRSTIGKNVGQALTKASSHLYRIAARMKDLAEPAPGFPTQGVPLEAILSGLEKQAADPARIDLRIPDALPPLKANAKQLAHLAVTLIDNIRAVAETAGEVRLEARQTPEAGEGKFQLHFIDGTPAWTSDQAIRFFAPFSVLEADARLGLDLAVCYFIAHHHGGQIDVPGGGDSKVVVTLPMDAEKAGSVSMDSSQLDRLFHYERRWEQFLRP
jgi:two-component system, probable response regulator PhcQ